MKCIIATNYLEVHVNGRREARYFPAMTFNTNGNASKIATHIFRAFIVHSSLFMFLPTTGSSCTAC